MTSTPVFRFAPSPNGRLHLGHAYSALLNEKLARQSGGKLLLRIEDIDIQRCTPELEAKMLDDLHWLGLSWDEPPTRQSDNFNHYREALNTLDEHNLLYPAYMSRTQIRQWVEHNSTETTPWPNDPDNAPHYPDFDKNLSIDQRNRIYGRDAPFALRLDMKAAMKSVSKHITWMETSPQDLSRQTQVNADPAQWGDALLARKDVATSYHLSCVVDDARQGVTHIVRGKDLFQATSLHRLLQSILGLPEPIYCHHDLILNETGAKLSKSKDDISLEHLRQTGSTPQSIRNFLGF